MSNREREKDEGASISSHNRNPKGKNQWGATSPLDAELEKVLRELNTQNLQDASQWLEKLREKGFNVGRTKMFAYKKQLGLSGSRNTTLTRQEQTQVVLNELERDPNDLLGPRYVWESLRLQGVHMPRDNVTQVMQDFHPEPFARRAPGHKVIRRTPLTALGPDDEWSMDGFDKLAKAGFPIYGIRDKFAGDFLHYRVLPSNRYAAVIGIVFLECVRKQGKICVQGTTDHGSEIRDSMSIHCVLRDMFAPDLLQSVVPHWKEVQSFRNITVERGWRPVFEQWGINVLDAHNAGLFGGAYESANDLHENLRKWIWFPTIQASLDAFTTEKNHRHIRKQEKKRLPSGGRPIDFYTNPEKYKGEHCGIPVDVALIDRILAEQMAQNGHLMRYVDDDFDELAKGVYEECGSPKITVENAWKVFEVMIQKLIP